MSVSAIELWQAGRSARVGLPDSETDLGPYLTSFEARESLGPHGRTESVSAVQLLAGAPVVVADPPLLTRRRVVRVEYSDRGIEEFRIVRSVRNLSGEAPASLQLEPLWMDLGASVAYQTTTGGLVAYGWALIGRTASDALAKVLNGAPAHFGAGTVASALTSAVVTIEAEGSTPLELLRRLCAAVAADTGGGCEWDIRWDSASSVYRVDLVEAVGGAIAHPIHGGGDGTRWTRRQLARTLDATGYFSRVVPLAGGDGEVVTVAGATWDVSAASYDATAGETTLTLSGDPIYVDGSPGAGVQLGSESGGWHDVESTTVPNAVVVSGDATPLLNTSVGWRLAGGDDLTYLADPAAETAAGRKERVLRRSDIVPYANVLEDAGVTPDLSDWVAGLPEGVQRSADSVTVTRSTDDRYVSAGTAAMYVEADEGEYVETGDLDLTGEGYVSAWVSMRVLSGSFRLELVAADGTSYPQGEEAVGAQDVAFRGLALGGLSPPPATGYRLRLTALADATEFVVDSWTLTRSPTPHEYAPGMGPRALWNAAGALLALEGGVQPDALEGSWYDLSGLSGTTTDAPRLGARVEVKDAGINVETRIVELNRPLAGDATTVRGRLGSRAVDVTGFLTGGRRRGQPTVGTRSDPALDVQVAVADGRAAPVLAIAYGPGYAALRIETPVIPDPAPSGYDPARGGPAGLPPTPAEAANTAVAVKTITGLTMAGGEATYTISVDNLDTGEPESALMPGEFRGEYRVYALRSANGLDTAQLAWSGILSGPAVAALRVEHDSVDDTTEGAVRFYRINGVRAVGGDLVWRQNAGAWTLAAVQAGSVLNDEPQIEGDAATGFNLLVAVSIFAADPKSVSFAVRTGAGTSEDEYRYTGVTTFEITTPQATPADINIRVTAEPATAAGRPEGTMFWLPEQEEGGSA